MVKSTDSRPLTCLCKFNKYYETFGSNYRAFPFVLAFCTGEVQLSVNKNIHLVEPTADRDPEETLFHQVGVRGLWNEYRHRGLRFSNCLVATQ